MAPIKALFDMWLQAPNDQKIKILWMVVKALVVKKVKDHPILSGLLLLYFANWLRKELKPRKSLRNEVVLITGAASGLGKNLARRFVQAGSTVVLWDINQAQLEQVERQLLELNGDVLSDRVDLSSRDEIVRASESLKAKLSPRGQYVTILINNAGVVSGDWITSIAPHKIEMTFRVNVLAHFWTIQAFLPAMIQSNRGHVVSIASAAGESGISKMTDYCSSKFAAVGLDEALRLELQQRGVSGVKTTCIMPFYINTGMFDGVQSKVPWLLPILDENHVCASIIRAIQKDQAVMKIPWAVYTKPLMNGLLPTGLVDFFAHAMGINSSMESFHGRRL